jgi:hypothetical protein
MCKALVIIGFLGRVVEVGGTLGKRMDYEVDLLLP